MFLNDGILSFHDIMAEWYKYFSSWICNKLECFDLAIQYDRSLILTGKVQS
jgi:hypothetical protein